MIGGGISRVLMTADAVGGVWTYSLELCAALGAAGVHVTLAVLGPRPSDAQRRMAASLPSLALHERPCRLEWMDDPWEDMDESGAWLLDLESRTGVDVVHLGGMSHGALPWRAPAVVVGHSCVLSWWEAVHGEPAPARYDIYRRRVGAGLAAADVVVAPTAAMLQAVARLYGAPRQGVVIPNARSAAAFRPARKTCVVAAAGRIWDAAKNLDTLDDIAAGLPWPVRIAGDLQAPDGSSRALRHAVALGPLAPAAMRDLLGEAAIYVHPARYEPFGLSVAEAALSGCALVLGDIPTLRESWQDVALFVPPGDRHALSAAINRLIVSPALRTALGQLARARALTWTPAAMAAAYIGVYRDARATAPAA